MNDRSTSTSTEQNEAVGSTTALPAGCQSNNSHFTVSNSRRVRQVNSISNNSITVNGAQLDDQISAARNLGVTALNSALFERHSDALDTMAENCAAALNSFKATWGEESVISDLFANDYHREVRKIANIRKLFLDVDGNLLNPKGRQQQEKKNSADTIYNSCKSLFDQDLTANKGNFFYMVY